MAEEEEVEQVVDDFEESDESDERDEEEEETDEDLLLENKLKEAQSRLSYGPFHDDYCCSPRLKELSRPPDRWLLELYEQYKDFMSPEKRKRIKRRIQEINMLTAE